MTEKDAIGLIERGVPDESAIWADIGAGTGMFTQALCAILGRRGGQSRIYAVDKSPHALWELTSTPEVRIIVTEADFNHPLDLPPLDGIVMANALHYANNHIAVMQNVLKPLKPDGTFILVEYDTETARPPWVPNPVSFRVFETLCTKTGLSRPEILGSINSRYGYERIYAAVCRRFVSF